MRTTPMLIHATRHLAAALVVLSLCAMTVADDAATSEKGAAKPQVLELANGKLRLPVPGDWEKVEPRVRIIEHEFSAAAADGDEQAGRVTLMQAGGSVEANVARWKGQFTPPADADEAAKVEEKTIRGLTVHLVDLRGTYHDSPRGPFGPKVDRPNYRMLVAMIQTRGEGNYFVRLSGPTATVEKHAESFHRMINNLEWGG